MTLVKVFSNGKVKVNRDDITVQVHGSIDRWPILKVQVSDKKTRSSYHTHYTVYDMGQFQCPDYRKQVAEQFVDRALSQRG